MVFVKTGSPYNVPPKTFGVYVIEIFTFTFLLHLHLAFTAHSETKWYGEEKVEGRGFLKILEKKPNSLSEFFWYVIYK